VSEKRSTSAVDSTLVEEAPVYDIDGNPIPASPPVSEDDGELYLPEEPIEFIIEE